MIKEIRLCSNGRGSQAIATAIEMNKQFKVVLPKGEEALKKTLKVINKILDKYSFEYKFELNPDCSLKVVAIRAVGGGVAGGVLASAACAAGFVAPIAIPIAVAVGACIGASSEIFDLEVKISCKRTGQQVIHFKTK